MEQPQSQHVTKKRSKLKKFKNELSKSSDIISEIDMINRKLEDTKSCFDKLLVVQQNIDQELSSQANNIESIREKNVNSMTHQIYNEIDEIKKQNDDMRKFIKELQIFLKKERKLAKKKIAENTVIKTNVSNFINEIVNDYNSLAKSTNEQRVAEGGTNVQNDKGNNNGKNGMKISHSLFDLYEQTKTTPLQKLLKDSKKKNTDPNSKSRKRQRKSQ